MSGSPLTIVINAEMCQGHGRCYDVCPEVFEPDVEGFGLVRDVVVEAGSLLAEGARRAEMGCPERAIRVDGP